MAISYGDNLKKELLYPVFYFTLNYVTLQARFGTNKDMAKPPKYPSHHFLQQWYWIVWISNFN